MSTATTSNPERDTATQSTEQTSQSPQSQQSKQSSSQPSQQQSLSIKELLQSIADQPVDLNNLDSEAIEEQGNILTQKAFFLLGLAQELEKPDEDQKVENKPENGQDPENNTENGSTISHPVELTPEQRRTRNLVDLLQNDAKTLMEYAVTLKTNAKRNITTDAKTMSKLQSFQDQIHRYDEYTDSLAIRTKGLVKDTIDSRECDELLHAGKAVLQVWIDKRNFLLSKALVGNEELLSELEGKLGDLIHHPDDLIDLVTDLRVNAVVFLNNVERHKDTIIKAANDINDVLDEKDADGKSLKDDDEVMYLINKVKNKIGGVVDESKNIDPDGTVREANDTAQKILDQIEEHDIVKKALIRGTQLLEEKKDSFDPEKLFDSDNNNEKSLDDFLNMIKNESLSFLMEYLPSITIPPLEHDDENCTYSLHNIDLSKFNLLSENVDVELIDHGVFVSATHISCEMDNLIFKYKSKSFPYPGASGVAYAKATGVSVALELRLEVTEVLEDETNGVLEKEAKNNNTNQATVELLSEENKTPTGSPASSASSYGQKEQAQQGETPLVTILTTTTTPTTSPQQNKSTTTTPTTSPLQNKSTTTITPSTSPQSTTAAQKLLSTINSKLHRQYKLVLFHHPQHGVIKIGELHMELRDFFLKSLANFLLSLFKTQVQGYIQRTINNVILQKSEKLLTAINRQVSKYLPIIAKILKKVESRAPMIENIVINAAKSIKNDVKNDREKATIAQQSQPNTPKSIQPKLEIQVIEKMSLENEKNENEKK